MMNNKRLGESNDKKFDNHTTVARGMINTRIILVYSRLQNIVRGHFFSEESVRGHCVRLLGWCPELMRLNAFYPYNLLRCVCLHVE